jgi:hypothetical protein
MYYFVCKFIINIFGEFWSKGQVGRVDTMPDCVPFR